MQSPMNYKTEYGLYRAAIRVLENRSGGQAMNRAWWINNALWYCEQQFPELLPQLRQLVADFSPRTIDDLIPVGQSIGV